MASGASTKESDSFSSGSSYTNSSSGDEDAQYRGDDVYGEEMYQVDYGAPGAGRSSEQLLKKGPVRYWFERICVSSYHDRRIPELRSFGVMWIMFCGSYTSMALRDLTKLKKSEEAFLFDVGHKMRTAFLSLMLISLVLSFVITIIAVLNSFGVSNSCPLLFMSSKRIKKTKTRDLVNFWFRPFVPWLFTVILLIIVDTMCIVVSPYYGTASTSELSKRILSNPGVMKDAKCCGVLGAEIDVGDDSVKKKYCPVTVSGCKFVVEHHSRSLRKYPFFLMAKIATLLILTWFSFGSIVGEPTDNQRSIAKYDFHLDWFRVLVFVREKQLPLRSG